MRRLLLAWLVALAACSEKEAAVPPPAAATERAVAPQLVATEERVATLATPIPAPATAEVAPAPAASPTPDGLLALRAYEALVNGRRAQTMRVAWRLVERDGRNLVEDVTEARSRSVRMMAGVPDVFESERISRTLRTEEGELISSETIVTTDMRIDKESIERTPGGYKVTSSAGPNSESFEIATERPAMVDAEAFLAVRIQRGEAKPGVTFQVPMLQTDRRRVVEAKLTVVGPDEEGPGLKVVETTDGEDILWWFAADGSVVRLRSGITVIRRDDSVEIDDLPTRPAAFRITLPSNVDLPRIFTTRTMVVDIVVQTDETTKPPQIPPSPFTEVVKNGGDTVTARLKSHDEPAATCPLPIAAKGLEEYLKPTPLMEVDDPEVRALARHVVGDAQDAREAARRIAEFVFSKLEKASPPIDQPTMKQILAGGQGDCSEHALLFTGLCRAAGIPARRCSGWVCIGDDWGGHGWCEVWVGKWIGADPTTNEVGTRARYIMLSRPDEPDTAPGRITAERTRIVIRRAEYADGTVEIGDTAPDPEIFSGIRLAELPAGWEVTRTLRGAIIRGPGFIAGASLHPDHGYRSMDLLLDQLPDGEEGDFGGRPAASSRALSRWMVPLGREILNVSVRTTGQDPPPADDVLAKLFAPTLARGDG